MKVLVFRVLVIKVLVLSAPAPGFRPFRVIEIFENLKTVCTASSRKVLSMYTADKVFK